MEFWCYYDMEVVAAGSCSILKRIFRRNVHDKMFQPTPFSVIETCILIAIPERPSKRVNTLVF